MLYAGSINQTITKCRQYWVSFEQIRIDRLNPTAKNRTKKSNRALTTRLLHPHLLITLYRHTIYE